MIFDEGLCELGELRMVPSTWMHGLDERGAGGGVDDQVTQCPQRCRGGLSKLEVDVPGCPGWL